MLSCATLAITEKNLFNQPESRDSGSAALDWCLAGLGIVLRSRWHAAAPLADGRLEEVLPDWHMPADVYAYFAAKKPSAQLRAFLDAMALRFEA